MIRKKVSALILSLGIITSASTSVSAEADISSFEDMKNPSIWYYNTMKWGVQNEIIKGYESNGKLELKPEGKVTEAEFLTMIIRFFPNTKEEIVLFQKQSLRSHWSNNYYTLANTYNVPVKGNSNMALRNDPINRGQVAQMIAGAFGKNFNVEGAIAFLYDSGLSKGSSSKTISGFEANKPLTRAEAVQFLKSIADLTNSLTLMTRAQHQQSNPSVAKYQNPVTSGAQQTRIEVQTKVLTEANADQQTKDAEIADLLEKLTELPKIDFDETPDTPVQFGYKTQWFVVKTENTDEIAKELNLTEIQASNWSTGIEGAYEGYYFITPPVKGWTLVVNSRMPDITVNTNENPLRVIEKLSKKYGEAYYFGTHRVVEYHAWAKAINGGIVRAYGYLGESGETLINQGGLTTEELENNLVFTDLGVDEPILPDEEHVLFMSKEWAVDPSMDYKDLVAGVGLVGKKSLK